MFDVFLRVEPKTHAISAHGLFQWLFVCHCVFFFLFIFFFLLLILSTIQYVYWDSFRNSNFNRNNIFSLKRNINLLTEIINLTGQRTPSPCLFVLLKDSRFAEDLTWYGRLLQSLWPKVLKPFFPWETLNSGIIIFILYFWRTGLLVNRNLKMSLINLRFSLLIVLYNST